VAREYKKRQIAAFSHRRGSSFIWDHWQGDWESSTGLLARTRREVRELNEMNIKLMVLYLADGQREQRQFSKR